VVIHVVKGADDGMTLALQFLTRVDWQLLRNARLAALFDSPHAFMSTYAVEQRWRKPEWQRMFDNSTWIVAWEAGKVIGLTRSLADPELPLWRHLESVWVAPTHRRRGVCGILLRAVAERERVNGVNELLLWVLEDNHDARLAYKSLGFEQPGERQYLEAVGQCEERLRLGIGDLLGSEASGSSALDR
jgi:ribosomal protein S18 acetylase RimI-like enzyme